METTKDFAKVRIDEAIRNATIQLNHMNLHPSDLLTTRQDFLFIFKVWVKTRFKNEFENFMNESVFGQL
jgi:hypothetical protein